MQERCARGDAWGSAKSIMNLIETKNTTFFSPTEFGVCQRHP